MQPHRESAVMLLGFKADLLELDIMSPYMKHAMLPIHMRATLLLQAHAFFMYAPLYQKAG